jgi:hypothetical protein
MSSAVKAIYHDGVFRPVEPVSLRDNTEVEVLLPSDPTPTDTDDPTGWKAIRSLIGVVKDAPGDASVEHDKYLYGDPHE